MIDYDAVRIDGNSDGIKGAAYESGKGWRFYGNADSATTATTATNATNADYATNSTYASRATALKYSTDNTGAEYSESGGWYFYGKANNADSVLVDLGETTDYKSVNSILASTAGITGLPEGARILYVV